MAYQQPHSTDPGAPTIHNEYPELDQTPTYPWSGSGLTQTNSSPYESTPGNPRGLPQSFCPDTITSIPESTLPFQLPPLWSSSLSQPHDATLTLREPSVLFRSGLNPGDEEDYDFLEQFHQEDIEELSDADTEYMNVRADVEKFADSVRKFRSEQRGDSSDDDSQTGIGSPGKVYSRVRGRGRASKGRTNLRGARKAAEPTGDIRYRLSTAVQAFVEENYEEAFRIVENIIRINAETHEAWTLLASIHREVGAIDHALSCMIFACHMRPKDVAGWLAAARFAMEETGEHRDKYLSSAKLCYSSAIRADPKNDSEARCGKAAVLREDGNTSTAISEYKHILKKRPFDPAILQLLAETYIDRGDPEAAKSVYKESIAFYQGGGTAVGKPFGWSDVNVYVEIHGYLGQYSDGIKELKSLSRWLLGRQPETFWDNVVEDDREWDLDDSRRLNISQFVSGAFALGQYGRGLPLELRVKLGIYRLKTGSSSEAMSHLSWLDPENDSLENRVTEYPELFRDSADALRDAGHRDKALEFYRAIRARSEYADSSLYLEMGKCHLGTENLAEAEECLKMAIQLDESNIDARILLAKLYEDNDEEDHAFVYMSEAMSIKRAQETALQKSRWADKSTVTADTFMPPKTESYYRQRKSADPSARQRADDLKARRLKDKLAVMRLEHKGMEDGLEGPSIAWMAAASELIEDFKSVKTFYPHDKHLRFQGYIGSTKGQPRTGAIPLEIDVDAMADRLSGKLGADVEHRGSFEVGIPENYRGISFPAWLDIFLEYALCLTRYDRPREAYAVCQAAKDAIVWYHNRSDMFLIHVGWASCAVLANDEETCVEICRFFMKEYQFNTDSYRMFAALSRLCQSPTSWYSSGPTQKYMLRQIKAMDYNLVDQNSKEKYFVEKASYTAVDENCRLVRNTDFDISLLMLYGHILYTGTSYAYALNYFLRAHALDPQNSMVNLSIGLGYVHYGLKRQAENRQFHIMQGLSFLFSYYESRRVSPLIEERQEAHYNMARTYHMLGLTHLALPYYMKVLDESCISGFGNEDLVLDAAYNLQTMYTMIGNFEMAQYITETWLLV